MESKSVTISCFTSFYRDVFRYLPAECISVEIAYFDIFNDTVPGFMYIDPSATASVYIIVCAFIAINNKISDPGIFSTDSFDYGTAV